MGRKTNKMHSFWYVFCCFCSIWTGEVCAVLAIKGGARHGFQWHWVCGDSGVGGCQTELHNQTIRTQKWQGERNVKSLSLNTSLNKTSKINVSILSYIFRPEKPEISTILITQRGLILASQSPQHHSSTSFSRFESLAHWGQRTDLRWSTAVQE